MRKTSPDAAMNDDQVQTEQRVLVVAQPHEMVRLRMRC